MNHQPIISIIIPIYNVELYLHQCLDSVYSQNLSNCEVICVNDGSTDGSRNILQEFKEKFTDLIIIDRENGGLIKARNSGYKYAKGEYIYYLDSDDYMLEGVIEHMLNFVRSNQLDVALFNSMLDTGKRYYDSISALTNVLSGPDFYKKFYKSNIFFPPSVQWMYLYRKQFLDENNIFFPEDNLQEDEPFTVKAYFHAKKAAMMDTPILFHRVLRQNSITQTAKLPHLIDARVAWKGLYEYLKNNNCKEDLFFHKVFLLYQGTISKLNSGLYINIGRNFLKKSDLAVFRKCAIHPASYKYYWYYTKGAKIFNWYQNGEKLGLLKKAINRLLTFWFRFIKS